MVLKYVTTKEYLAKPIILLFDSVFVCCLAYSHTIETIYKPHRPKASEV